MRKRRKAKLKLLAPAGERDSAAAPIAEKPTEEFADVSAAVRTEREAELKEWLGLRYVRLGRAGLAKINRRRGHPARDRLVDAIRFFAVKEREAAPHRRGDGDRYERACSELSQMDPLLFCGLRVLPAEPGTLRKSFAAIAGSPWAAEYADLEDLLHDLPMLLCPPKTQAELARYPVAELIPMMDRQVGKMVEQFNRLGERTPAKFRTKQALRRKTAR
jgi:hypothetical protein